MKNKKNQTMFVKVMQFTGLFLLSAVTVWADQTWVGAAGTTNDWNAGANWNGGVVPSNTVALITNGGTALIGTDVPKVTSIYAGSSLASSGASGSVVQTNGAVLVTGGTYPLLVGYQSMSNAGLYDISGGTLTVTGGVFVGSSETTGQSYGTGLLRVRGTGIMDFSGSKFFVAHYGRTGTVEVADSGRLTLRGSPMRVGVGGAANVGTLTVSGGTLSAPGLETAQTGGNATVNISGGSLWLDWLTAGTGVSDIRLSGNTLGAQTGNANWSAPMALTDDTVTFYTGNQIGAARVNTASGMLSGNGSLVITSAPGQVEPGTLVLGADNTFTGGTTLQGNNTLQFGAGGTTGWLSSALAITDNGRLVFNRSDVVTNSMVISGTSAAVTQNGSGTLVLTNESPAFASANANAGVLRFATPAAIPGSGASVTINNGGAVAVGGAYNTVIGWLNSGRIAPASGGALAFTDDSSEDIDLTAAGSGLYTNLSLGASGSLTYSGTLTPINGIYRLGGGNGTLTYTAPITGGSVVIDEGAGTVVLDAANTFDGGVTVNSGTLRAGDSNGLGSGLITINSGVLQVNSALQAVGGILVTNTGMVQIVPGGSIEGLVVNQALDGGAGTKAGVVFDGNATFTHADDISGAGMLAVIGNGKLKLETPAQTISQRWVFAGNNGSAGDLEMTFGTLNATEWLVVARGASQGTPLSTFTLSGGTVNKTGAGRTFVGDSNGSIGSMVISNTALYNAAGGDINVSVGNGTGTLTVQGGRLNQTVGNFIVANNNGRGAVNLYGGAVTNSAGSVYVGYGAGGTGTLTMTNGVLYSKNYLSLGQLAGANGTLNLSGGAMTVGTLLVGAYGQGTLLQTGGILSGGSYCVGRFPGGVGSYTLAGGTLNQAYASGGLIVGEQGTGNFIVMDTGVANLSGSYGLVIGHNTGTGTVTLARGGLISTLLCQKFTGTSRATFNFDGGTLLARANNANFMQGLTLASVKAGGAVIDSGNNTITVAQNLMTGASPDGGLTKLGSGALILSGKNSYNGVTTISNGTLRLGSANAITNIGAVRVAGGVYDLGGFTVTNGAVTLESGSIINGTLNASTYSATGDSKLVAGLAGAGGLIKSGDGTLTLKALQTYTGPTLVSGGVLKLEPTGQDALIHYDFDSANISGTTVVNLGTGGAAYNGVINGAVTKGAPGHLGEAVSFGGTGQGVVTANSVALTNAFTFATWVKSNGAYGQYQRIINNAWQTGGYLGTDNANKFLTIIKSTPFVSSSQSSADTAAWHHVAMVWDGMNVTLYYDGTAIQTKTYTGTDASLVSKIGFGNNVGPTAEYWNGSMDDAYVFGRALSSVEVEDLCYGNSNSTNLLPAATSLQLANNAVVELGGNAQTVASLSGNGSVSNGLLTVTGVIAPGGTNVIGTLSISAAPVLSGTLLVDMATGTCDRLEVQGGVDVSQLTLEVANPSEMNKNVDYVLLTCTPGMLIGELADAAGVPALWRIRYNRAAGEVKLAYQRGTVIVVR